MINLKEKYTEIEFILENDQDNNKQKSKSKSAFVIVLIIVSCFIFLLCEQLYQKDTIRKKNIRYNKK